MKLTDKILEANLSDVKSDVAQLKTQAGGIKTDVIALFEMHSTQHKAVEKVIDAIDDLWKSLSKKN